MPAPRRYRTFSARELENRDAYVTANVENDCAGCVSDGELWRPAEDCPVHGASCDPWWADLNVPLDARWPGTWGTLP